MQGCISEKEKDFLYRIIPNTETFVNKLIKWPLTDIKYLKKQDYNTILEYLAELGCYIPKPVKCTTLMGKNFVKLNDIMYLIWKGLGKRKVLSILKGVDHLSFRVYRTIEGETCAYCTNKKFNHEDYKTLQLMKDLKCDEEYIHLVASFGFVKKRQKETFECEIGVSSKDILDYMQNIFLLC